MSSPSPQKAPRAHTPRTRSAFAAAFLSLIFPGLGHAYAGAWARALAFAALPLLLIALARRDLPAGRQVRPARVRRPAAGADRHLRRQHPDPDLPHRGGGRRVERRAVPERGRRLGRWPARALEAPAEPAVDRRPPRRPDRDRGRAHRRRPLRPARVDPRRLRVQRQRGRPVPGAGRLARSRRDGHRTASSPGPTDTPTQSADAPLETPVSSAQGTLEPRFPPGTARGG